MLLAGAHYRSTRGRCESPRRTARSGMSVAAMQQCPIFNTMGSAGAWRYVPPLSRLPVVSNENHWPGACQPRQWDLAVGARGASAAAQYKPKGEVE